MKTRTLHRALSMLLTAAMVFNIGLTPVFAAEGATTPGISGVCTHHTEHTEDCGNKQGTPCTHEHTKDCSTTELACDLVEGGAPETATDSEAAEQAEAHTHSENCYTKTDHCTHTHDETCGYTPDSPCTFDPASCTQCNTGEKQPEQNCICEPTIGASDTGHGKDCPLYTAPECICPPVDSGEPVHGIGCPLYTTPALSEAVQALIVMVDALPNAADITEENRETIKPAFDAALTAYEALTAEDKTAFEATAQYTKLMALHGVLYAMMPMAAGDKVELIRNGSLVATYADLNTALLKTSQIQSGDTVKLLDNVRTTNNLVTASPSITNITFDLNGKTVAVGYNTFGGYSYGFSTYENQTLNIKNGKITYTSVANDNSDVCQLISALGTVNLENVDMVIDGGISTDLDFWGLYCRGGTINATNCSVVIETQGIGRTATVAVVATSGIINIVGGNYSAFVGLRNSNNNGTITISAQADKLLRVAGYSYSIDGTVTISSGTELLRSYRKADGTIENYYARTSDLKTFSGTVKTAGGAGVGATITVTDENGYEVYSATSNSGTGAFTGKLLPGTYTVKITAAGYLDTSDTITVTADDAHKDYTLTTMNRIIVTTTADEAALGNVQVIASKGGKKYTATGSTSPYTVIVPEAGVYTVSVSRGGYISPATQTATFTAADGETQNLAFELTSDFIYDIFTKEDLIKFSNAIVGSTTYKGKTVNLRGNIDMRGVNFVPYSGTFAGTFEGNGYTISNLSISGNYKNVRLFPSVNSATICNLGVVNCNMKSTYSTAFIGGIVGKTTVRTVIENCYVTGTVGDTVNTGGYAGGIAGWFQGSNLYESRIENCYSNVNLRSNKSQFRDTQLATIVTFGTAATDVTLKNSYFTMTNYGYYNGGNAATVTGVELQTNPANMAEKLNANITTAGKEGAWVPWVQSGTGFPSFGTPEYTCKVGGLEFVSLSAAINYALQNSDAAFITMIADETLNAPITIPTGKSLTLLAEGDCTISRGTAAAAGGRMFIISGTETSLTLGAAGGMGNGNSLTFDGIGKAATDSFFGVLTGAVFSMYDDVKITGMARTGMGNAAAIYANGTSVLNIVGGEISGNSIGITGYATAAGIYMNAATLNLTGGKIIGNTGNGIFAHTTTTVNLSGNPVVQDNILSDGKTARNLCLRNVANVKGALAGGATIGVSHDTPPTTGEARPFAQGNGYALSDTDLTRFTSDVNGFELRKNASDQFELFVNVQYTLTVTGGTGGGQYSEGETVTVTADVPSSGKQFKEWTVSPTVTFTEGTSKTDSTAKFTMPNGAVTAEATYEDIPAGHTHAWATAWTTDTAHHWHECTAGNCTVSENSSKDGYAAHAGTWTTDATNHSKICTICSYVMVASTAHVYDDATDTTCNTCGYVRTIAATITGVSVSPATANVQKGTTQSFSAIVSGTGAFDSTVTWSVNGGAGTSVSSSGVLTVAAGETARTLTVTATATADTTKKGTATVTVTSAAVTKYLVTVNGGTGGAEYERGNTVTITATVPLGKQFKTWTVNSGAVTLANSNSEVTTFAMPNSAVTITATFEDITHTHSYTGTWKYDTSQHWQLCSCGEKGNISNHSGNPCTVCGYSYSSGGDADGNTGGSTGGGNITHTSPKASYTLKDETFTISRSDLQALVDGGKSLTIIGNGATLVFDTEALKAVLSSTSGDVSFGIRKIDPNTLSKEAQKAIGNHPVFSFTVTSGKQSISDFGKGKVSVKIDYIPTPNEAIGQLYGVYVDKNGKVEWLTSSSHNLSIKGVVFATNHFSVFGIGYKATTSKFTDTANHWAKNDIDFVVARGLFTGTSNTTFAPETGMTRGMFVTALGRLAGVDTKKYPSTKFTDVAANAYYAPYVAWAAQNSITGGTSDTTFSPDKTISRQEMAVMLVNYSKAIGYKLPSVHAEVTFTDAGSIGSFAKDAVKQTQMAGILTGKSGNRFDPTATATRAEVSAMLRRYVELVVNTETAEGWSMNESGQWMYIENGKRTTGKKTIDGMKYTFDQYGVTTALPPEHKYLTYTV